MGPDLTLHQGARLQPACSPLESTTPDKCLNRDRDCPMKEAEPCHTRCYKPGLQPLWWRTGHAATIPVLKMKEAAVPNGARALQPSNEGIANTTASLDVEVAREEGGDGQCYRGVVDV